MVELSKFPSVICHYRVSNEKLSVLVKIRNGKIIDAAPVVQVFIGQPLDNLAAWMRKMGETTVDLLNLEEDTARERDQYA